jgi:hypothetical protein
MGKTAGVIGVQVSEDDLANITGCNAKATKLRSYLVVWTNGEANCKPKERMPTRKVAFLGGAGCFASIDDDDAFRMLDDPGVDGKRLNPFFVGENIEEALNSLAPTDLLSSFDGNGSCLNSVDADHAVFLLLIDMH